MEPVPQTNTPDVPVVRAVRPGGSETTPVNGVRVPTTEPLVAPAKPVSTPPCLGFQLPSHGVRVLRPVVEVVVLPSTPCSG